MNLEAYQDKTDEELAKLSAEDPHAFVPLVKRYEGKLLAYIRRISGFQKEDAEDVLQEAFMDAYRHIADFDSALKFSSWMYRITHNRTISTFRKGKSRMTDVSIDDEDMGFERILSVKEEGTASVERSLTVSAVKQVLDRLPERDREVLVLAYIEEKSYEEISDILQAPMGTVGTWIRRAKVKFAKTAKENPALIQ
ncbi:MAG: RNA polymerase sigma factor [Patescibacteria group bacterium]|nr:RNA polymerase sigma factor [Patescibacteria group bacterium]